MAALKFPANPDVNDTYTENGYTWQWDGVAWLAVNPSSMVYPDAGVAISTGTDWDTSKANPTGAFVGTTDTQTLTNKTINGSNNTITNVSLTTGVTGTLPVENGGTGRATLTSNNVLLGSGTSAINFVAPGTSGNVLTSNGTTWTSAAPVTPTIASTAEAQAGTNNTNFITPLRMREGFNASGSAPVYACRAWVNFDGTTAGANPAPMTIRASGNVSSVTRTATGDYTVNFTTAMSDNNYAAALTVRVSGATGAADYPVDTAFLTGSVRVRSSASTSGAATNAILFSVAIFR